MRELIEKKTQMADSHHSFTYDKGIKTAIPDNGIVYLYMDKYGLLHASKWEDIAGESGRFIKTDEVSAHEGLPYVNGSVYTIFGAGESYVYLTKNKNAKFHTSREETNKILIAPHGKAAKRSACEILRQMYVMLTESVG